jgi:hypothetical protein
LREGRATVYRFCVTVRRVLLFTLFLYMVDDDATTYGTWFAPMEWAHWIMFLPMPDKLRVFDHVSAICLYVASSSPDGKGPRVPAMRKALLAGAGTIVALFLYGVVRGGDSHSGMWQIYFLLSGILFAFTCATAFKTPEHYVQLAKVIMAAGAYRAVMCWLYYWNFIYGANSNELPEFLTTHDDTVIWVVSLLVLFLNIVQSRGAWPRLKSFLFVILLLGAILFNQRRLAWVSLAMGLAIVIPLMAPGKAKKRIVRALVIAAPVLVIYVAVGWGQPGRIFKPLQSFSSVSTAEDASTKARNAENLGLIATSNYSSMLVGTGWGHPYVPVTMKYSDAHGFPLWQYIPHNNILCILAFSGVIGFCGYWMIFPTAMFLNARMARLADTPLARNIGLIGAAQLLVCANQYYGDMGLYFVKSVYMCSVSYAIALRLPILTGTMAPPGKRRRPAAQRAPSEAAA